MLKIPVSRDSIRLIHYFVPPSRKHLALWTCSLNTQMIPHHLTSLGPIILTYKMRWLGLVISKALLAVMSMVLGFRSADITV